MKKFMTILLLTAIATPVFAENFFAPEWEDFAPSRYKNIETDRFHLTGKGRYWADRKAKFEQRVAKCETLEGEAKGACFKELRNIEENATKMYNDESTTKVIRNLMYSL